MPEEPVPGQVAPATETDQENLSELHRKSQAVAADKWSDGDWGYCSYCKTLYPLTAAGHLPQHGWTEPRAKTRGPTLYTHPACNYVERVPDIAPTDLVLKTLALRDKAMQKRISIINELDPRED